MSQSAIARYRSASAGYHPGWGVPEYTNWQDEQMSWKTSCYVGDWSFLNDLEIVGPDAIRLFSDTSVNSFAKFAIGQAKHVVQCSGRGKLIAEGVLMRMSEDCFRVQSSPARWLAFHAEKGGYDVRTRPINTFQYQVSGPTALAVCEAATGESLVDIPFMHFREVNLGGRQAFALRQGMAGEPGFEFHGAREDGEAVMAAILEAGEGHGLRRLGGRTVMLNHLEAAFPTGSWHYSYDLFGPEAYDYLAFVQRTIGKSPINPALRGSHVSDDIEDYLFSPFELGWGKSVKFDHDFIGREALEKEAQIGSRRKRVTLKFNSDDVVDIYASLFEEGEPYAFMDIPHQTRWIAWADTVLKDGKAIGISSPPGYSLYFKSVLTLAFIETAHAEPGTEVEVVWGEPGKRQKRIRATVFPAPIKVDRRREPLAGDVQQIAAAEQLDVTQSA